VAVLREMGVDIEVSDGGVRVDCRQERLRPVDVTTEPYPGFPTDMQAQLMATVALALGESRISETIFESRFMHVPELRRMGARIELDGGTARICGTERLIGAPVMATDLRASVALVLAGLAADGQTRINRVYHLDRGYEGIESKLIACGADIRRVSS
ncbi:MAG: UDP-N-acetylglucosamine 1-carboxyvinyltransferase, partial [Rhodobacteraceae bacterium]|nr:UDP-N-acetylglucosamine 1-carboxyvinyltransferase [Paracoccaceae bacterium]